jgi:hypothetical protein
VRRLSRYEDAVAAVDAANSEDPTLVPVRGEDLPLALAHGRLAAEWVPRLVADPDEAVLLAARAHHLRRWELPRTDYPEGRGGYLRWRRDQKARHARDVEAILAAVGYDGETIGRVQALVRREGLGTDPAAQAVEDAACLVFLETQLVSVAPKIDSDRYAEVIRKTAAKMSPTALALVAEAPLSDEARALLSAALG